MKKRLPKWKRQRLAESLGKIEKRIHTLEQQLVDTADEGNAEDAYDWCVSARMSLSEAMHALEQEDADAV